MKKIMQLVGQNITKIGLKLLSILLNILEIGLLLVPSKKVTVQNLIEKIEALIKKINNG